MKKLTFLTVLAMAAMFLVSCGKSDYQKFIGTWGVERIEYFNIDFQGDPILASADTFYYDPYSVDNGIQLVFKANKTGEMRDSAFDSLYTDWNPDTQEYETAIYCPDSVLVKTFTYSYDKSEQTLYLNMEYAFTYRLIIHDISTDEFVYDNEYDEDYIERAYLKRIDKSTTTKSTGKKPVRHPHKKPGSLFGDR